jgi:hypothetical protein
MQACNDQLQASMFACNVATANLVTISYKRN